jgi:hypothetical protein
MARAPKFVLIFAPETVRHMDAIESKYHSLIERTINQQLQHAPERETRNRKPLDEAGPYGATWDLRFGPQNRLGVFYEVNDSVREVGILAIGVKERNRLFIGGKEYAP